MNTDQLPLAQPFQSNLLAATILTKTSSTFANECENWFNLLSQIFKSFFFFGNGKCAFVVWIPDASDQLNHIFLKEFTYQKCD